MVAAAPASAQFPDVSGTVRTSGGRGPRLHQTCPSNAARPISKVTGTTAGWSRSTRTLRVQRVLRTLRRGHRALGTATGSAARRSPVPQAEITRPGCSISRAANRNLARRRQGDGQGQHRLGASLQTSARRPSATAFNARVASLATSAADFRGCSNWYWHDHGWGHSGPPTRWWWDECVCEYQGFLGSQTAMWWDYYYWNGNNVGSIYGQWRRYDWSCWYSERCQR